MELKFRGDAVSTNAEPTAVGEQFPNFSLTDLDGNTVTLDDLKGNIVIFSIFPDITKNVCACQTDKINDLATELSDVTIVSLSANTVEELSKFFETKTRNHLVLHDDQRQLAKDTGLHIESVDVFARALYILDEEGKVTYREVVSDLIDEPNYDKVFEFLK